MNLILVIMDSLSVAIETKKAPDLSLATIFNVVLAVVFAVAHLETVCF